MGNAKPWPRCWLHGFVDLLTVLRLHEQVAVDVEARHNNAEFVAEWRDHHMIRMANLDDGVLRFDADWVFVQSKIGS